MSLELLIKQNSEGLRSEKVTERKKCAETLKNFLNGESAPSLLSKNTLCKTGITWNDLFDDLNEFILKESPKHGMSTFDNMKALSSSLLFCVVAGAIKGKAFIKCERVVEACLLILKNNSHARAFGDVFMNLLYKCILPCDYYVCHISPQLWEELLVVSIACYNSLHCKLDEFTNLRIIFLIIQSSTANCQFVTQLRDTALNFLKCNIYSTQDKRVQETILEMATSVLETLSVECHETVCEYTEFLIPHIVRFYDGQSEKKKKAMFRCFEISIRIHHPDGILKDDEGFCAHDCSSWKNCLENILEIICKEANSLQKILNESNFKSQNRFFSKDAYESFIQVAALVYYQVFNNTFQSLEACSEENVAKRPRMQYNRHSTFNDLIDQLQHECMPWLSIIAVYLQKYGKSVSSADNLYLLNVLESLLKTNIANINYEDFQVATIAVLKNICAETNKETPNCNNLNAEVESLWKSCIRCSTSINNAHVSIHAVLRAVLNLGLIYKKKDLNILMKLYKEKAMPVTENSLATFNTLLEKSCGKFNNSDERLDYLSWVVQNENTSVDAKIMTELFLRLLSKDCIQFPLEQTMVSRRDTLYNVLFDSIDRCLLFSDFILDIANENVANPSDAKINQIELHSETTNMIKDFLEIQLLTYIQELKTSKNLTKCVKFIHFILSWNHSLLKYGVVDVEHIVESQVWLLLKEVICLFFKCLTKVMKEDKTVIHRVEWMNSLQILINTDYPHFICREIYVYINADFIKLIYTVLKEIKDEEEEDLIEVTEQDNELFEIKSACINLLTIYCTKNDTYRSQILEFILNADNYNFSCIWDVNVALNCIDLLTQNQSDFLPLDLIFGLMQNMCKVLFRSSEVTGRMLAILYRLMDRIGSHQSDVLRENCIRMLNGYLRVCESLHYHPRVAALIYKCLAKVEELKHMKNQKWNCDYRDAILLGTKCNVHVLRLYCCYLLKYTLYNSTENDIANITSHLENMFLIPNNNDLIVKDELKNRASSVFHFLTALVLGKETFMNTTVVRILEIHVTKSRNKYLVERVLRKITETVVGKEPQDFLNGNLFYLLRYWFSKNYRAEDLPYSLFGFPTYNHFVQKHMHNLIPFESLWCKEGNLEGSTVLLFCKTNFGMSEDSIFENCFPITISLCLPHLVTRKYRLNYASNDNGIKMLQAMQNLLGTKNWNHILVKSIPDIVATASTLLYDANDIKIVLEVAISQDSADFYYPKEVFQAILTYLEEKIGVNVIQYLCETPQKPVSKILFELWANILNENLYELKVLSLYRFVTFLNNIPSDCSAFAFVYHYTCLNLTNIIRKSNKPELIKIYCNTMLIVVKKLLPEKLEIIKDVIPQLMSVLVFKAEDGHRDACLSLSNYVLVDMNYCLRESLDLVDGIDILSQGVAASQNTIYNNQRPFVENLSAFLQKSKCWSYETLCSLKDYLKTNRVDILRLFNELNLIKGFSEDCETSMVHQIINNLIDIVKESHDKKSRIEAENCLAQMDIYDLKTIVMRVPRDTKIINDARPDQYFVLSVLQNIADVIVDENPAVADKSVQALISVLSFREGKLALENARLDNDVLYQFMSSRTSSRNVKFNIDEDKLVHCLNSLELWNPSTVESNNIYMSWLVHLTTALLESFTASDNFIASLINVCKHKSLLCQKILPSLMSLVIHFSSESHVKVIGERINRYFEYFFQEICNSDSQHSNDAVGSQKIAIHQHKQIIQTMLEVVDFVRLQKPHYKKWCKELTENYNYLKLDYKCVAWAAAVSDKPMAAIYYGELWCAAQNKGVPPASPQFTAEIQGGEDVLSIFRKCFVSIGEMDAIDGCGTGHLTDVGERRRHLMRSRQYSDALLSHDIALSVEKTGNIYELHHGIAISLIKSGLRHLAVEYVKTLPDNEDLDDIKYQCFMELGDWSLFVDTSELEENSKNTNVNFDSVLNALQYSCLKDILNIQRTKDFENRLILPIERAKIIIMQMINKLNMDNCQSVYNVLAKLHLFTEIEDYFSIKCNKVSISEVISKWQIENLSPYQDFKHIEPIILQRSIILEQAAKTYTDYLENIVMLHLKFSEVANMNGRWQLSDRLVATAKEMLQCGEVSLVESQMYWIKGHKDIALSIIRQVLSDTAIAPKLQASALRQYGTWMAESKYESAREIIDKYLMKSLDVLGPNGHTETRLKVYLDIAMFADSEYKQVVSYIKSSVFENKVRCVKNMRGAATTLKNSQQTMSSDEKKAMYTNTRLSNLEQAEIDSTFEEKNRFLVLAVKYYLFTLNQGEEDDLSVFRVISLWFENPTIDMMMNDEEDGNFAELLNAVPSRKYLPVLPQLSPRLTARDNSFSNNLRNIITKCAIDHPHHTLPILFSLKNSHKDKIIMNTISRTSVSVERNTDEPRVFVARQLVQELEETVSSLTAIIQQMDNMCDALISFANYASSNKKTVQDIPKAEPLLRLTNLNEVPVPTSTLKIQKNCIYTDFASVVSFSKTFELVGGVNCPKKLTCRGSDGRLRTILVKGQDDLRQDAVMQQVFTIVNTLLEKNPITSKNKLLIRTYKVVPLSRRSGVLEWCEGTIPIGAYLVGTPHQPGAHQRYRPKDISCNAARAKMNSRPEERRTNAEKLAIFLSILKDLKPVFHYFFTEHYLEPVMWYERRLAYVKSVATSSMVGYIMGLGDRHVQNILIDKNTAEVIHIDFGIAFDQGKALPTPETVPFRLTQDIIAGFGPSGVDGVFRRCCEKTLQLLRDNQETLLTILEVLLCDPLYSWTITPAEAKRKQSNLISATDQSNVDIKEEEDVAGLAQRALLAVRGKLAGEAGAARGVAVQGQVARLLHQAADPVNLSRLFYGWQPYL